MSKVFVFDLDDTLMDTMHSYSQPLLDAAQFIIARLGNKAPYVSTIINMECDIDRERVKEINPMTGKPFLYSMERFPGTLVKVYQKIRSDAGITGKDHEAQAKLYEIGLKAFDDRWYAKNISPDAQKVHNFLWQQGNTLVLCTKGDKRVQEKKIAALSAAGVFNFHKIFVVDIKTTATFAEIAMNYPNQTIFSIGNSFESDIEPAMQAGYHGIYVPLEGWEAIGKMEDIFKRANASGATILSSLGELIDVYGDLP